MNAREKRIVVVAGMHRAGTSVVACALQALGVDLGERLMSADVRMNARGFFEDIDVVALDDALLDALGADWKSIALLHDAPWHQPALAESARAARQLLMQRLAPTGSFGFKDPRVPRLLPFWQAAFADVAASAAYVIAVRHPLSVIASLTTRDALDVRRSAWLWLIHLVCALHYTRGFPRVIVDYDHLLAQPLVELARMVRALHLDPAVLESARVAAYMRDFLSNELRHARHDGNASLDPAIASIVGPAYALVQRLASDALDVDATESMAAIEVLYGQLVAASPLLGYAGSVERRADDMPRLAGELAWATSSLAESQRFAASLQETLASRTANLEEARAYSEDLLATIARKDRELVAIHGVLERVRAQRLGKWVLRRMK